MIASLLNMWSLMLQEHETLISVRYAKLTSQKRGYSYNVVNEERQPERLAFLRWVFECFGFVTRDCHWGEMAGVSS